MTIAAKPKAAAGPEDRVYTAEELLLFPDEWRYELVEGRLREMPPTSDDHGSSTMDISVEIGIYVRANDLGRCWAAETGFVLARDPDTVLAPDFSFIAKERTGYQRTGHGYVPIAPDLVVETRSPSDRLPTMRDKMAQWLGFGVRIALLLDPIKRTLMVYTPNTPPVTLAPDDTFVGGEVLPSFALPLGRLFPE